MKKQKIKEALLGEIGAGILLIILNFVIVGFNFSGEFFQILGHNILLLFGIACIIDGIRNKKIHKK